MSVNLDGSGKASREIPNEPGGFIDNGEQPLVHLPNLREHEVSTDGSTYYCSVGGGELVTLSSVLETTGSISLPKNMCKPLLQRVTSDYYIVKTDMYVRVFGRESRSEQWKKPLEAYDLIAHAKTLYLATLNSGLIALDLETGERLWEFQQSLRNLISYDATLYGTQLDTVAIDLSSNETKWRGKKRGDVLGTPHLIDDTVIVPTVEYIYGYNVSDGSLEYRAPLPESISNPADYRVYGHSTSLYFKSDSDLRRVSIEALSSGS